jgi:hypothetical protein
LAASFSLPAILHFLRLRKQHGLDQPGDRYGGATELACIRLSNLRAVYRSCCRSAERADESGVFGSLAKAQDERMDELARLWNPVGEARGCASATKGDLSRCQLFTGGWRSIAGRRVGAM